MREMRESWKEKGDDDRGSWKREKEREGGKRWRRGGLYIVIVKGEEGRGFRDFGR